jgi:multidrug resistance efflux pump
MRREARLRAHARVCTLICVLALAALAVSGCARGGRSGSGLLELTGSIVADRVEVQVPALALPVVDVTAGLPSASTFTSGTSASASASSTAATQTSSANAGGSGSAGQSGSGSQRSGAQNPLLSMGSRAHVVSMAVQPGDHVSEGDILAELDRRMLDAGVRFARDGARVASANIGVIEQRISDLGGSNADLDTQRSELTSTVAHLQETSATLASQLTTTQAALAQVDASIKAAQSHPATGTPPPGMPTLAQLQAQRAKILAGIAKIEAAIAKVSSGIKKAQEGITKIDEGKAKMSEARSRLEIVLEAARAAADAANARVELAQTRADQATVRATAGGTVIEAARVGDVLAAGAPLVVIERDTAREVETWVEAGQSKAVRLGQGATVQLDSRPGESFSAQVTFIAKETAFPPTSHATKVIHMVRALRVRVTLHETVGLPAGTPAEVTITTR